MEQHWKQELEAGWCMNPEEVFLRLQTIAKKTEPVKEEFDMTDFNPSPDYWQNYAFEIYSSLRKHSPKEVWYGLENCLKKPGTDGDFKDLVIGPHEVWLFVESVRALGEDYRQFDFSMLTSDSEKVEDIIYFAKKHTHNGYVILDTLSPQNYQVDQINIRRLERDPESNIFTLANKD